MSARIGLVGVIGALLALAVTGCGLSPTQSATGGGRVRVVAAENFWGSIATQVGGDRAQVTSIIANPDTDPHEYEATPADARAIAQARYVIINGAGYDPWLPKLLAANPVPGRRVLTIADLIGRKEGDNPHMWYSPAYVDRVVDRITSDLASLDSANASYFQQHGSQYRSEGLREYHGLVTTIRQKYAGTRVGASESICSYLADGLGLDLLTPYSYLKAISEGTDPSASDKAYVQAQIDNREIRVFVFNSQNSTPDVQSLVTRAKRQGIPVTTITETLTPAGATFQDWQSAQLRSLLQALGG